MPDKFCNIMPWQNGCSNTLSNPMVDNVDVLRDIGHPMVENDDVIWEILLRADPACIFKYILVSKRWLNLISSRSFKKEYMKRWNMKEQDFKLIGFLVYDLRPVDYGQPSPPAVQLLPTSEFGRFINRSEFMRGIGYFIAVTPDGLILCGEHLKRYYVFNTVTNRLIQLPLPPMLHKDASIAIWSRDEGRIYNRMENFEVMYAKSNSFGQTDDTLSIQIFSASTGQWRTSTFTSSTAFSLCRGIGIVVRGVLYWMARIARVRYFAALNANNRSDDSGHITLIRKPESPPVDGMDRARKELSNYLGVTCDGLLQYAAYGWGNIEVWVLIDDHLDGQIDADISRWSLLYTINLYTVIEENFGLFVACDIQDRRRTTFVFETFVPGKPDSVFLRHEQHFFICHSDTHKLERINYYVDDYGYPFGEGSGWWGKRWHRPLTVLDPWPSSPLVSSDHY